MFRSNKDTGVGDSIVSERSLDRAADYGVEDSLYTTRYPREAALLAPLIRMVQKAAGRSVLDISWCDRHIVPDWKGFGAKDMYTSLATFEERIFQAWERSEWSREGLLESVSPGFPRLSALCQMHVLLACELAAQRFERIEEAKHASRNRHELLGCVEDKVSFVKWRIALLQRGPSLGFGLSRADMDRMDGQKYSGWVLGSAKQEFFDRTTYIYAARRGRDTRETIIHEQRHLWNQYSFPELTQTRHISSPYRVTKEELLCSWDEEKCPGRIFHVLFEREDLGEDYDPWYHKKNAPEYEILRQEYQTILIRSLVLLSLAQDRRIPNLIQLLSLIPFSDWGKHLGEFYGIRIPRGVEIMLEKNTSFSEIYNWLETQHLS